jgi:hypothetical protein
MQGKPMSMFTRARRWSQVRSGEHEQLCGGVTTSSLPITAFADIGSLAISTTPESFFTRIRVVLFNWGIFFSVLSVLITMSFWIDPYPLVSTPDGGYSIAWLDLAWEVAIGTACCSILLALFGRGVSRILLVASGITLLVLIYGSILQNGV